MAIPENMPDALADVIRAHGGEWREWRLGAHRWFAAGSPHNIYACLTDSFFAKGKWVTFWTKSDPYDDECDFQVNLNDDWGWDPDGFIPGLEAALRKPPPTTKESLLSIAGQCKSSNVSYVKEMILQLANSLDN